MLRSALLLLILPASLLAQDIEKCFTPQIVQAYQAGVRLKTPKQIGDGMHTAAIYLSPSGKFRLNYVTTGADAVPTADANSNGVPDYVEKAALYADQSYQMMVVQQGFRDPIGATPYQIYFEDLNFYGYTQPSGGTTFIAVHNTFQGFPANDDPEGRVLGALKVTIAHEFKHAIQYATNQWAGDAGRVDWVEMDATMMEDVVYPQVNDYRNYLGSSSIFRNPSRSTPGSYNHVTWMLYYTEVFGIQFWVDVWNRVVQNGNQMIPTIRTVLTTRNASYAETFARNHAWHYASGSRSGAGYGFAAKFQYPTALTFGRIAIPDSLLAPETLPRSSARYYTIIRPPNMIGEVSLTLIHSLPATGVALLGYGTDGTLRELIVRGNESGTILVSTDWNWDDLTSLGLVVANANETATLTYQYRVDSETVPEVPTLLANAPNPFNPSTSIRFTLPERQRITLDVLDALGRRVATLLDEERNAGRYAIPFDANGLATGVYIYRLVTPDKMLTGKMLLLR
jgi:hypothetical protein